MLEQRDGGLSVGIRGPDAEIARAEYGLECLRIHRTEFGEARLLRTGEARVHLTGDSQGHFALEGQHIAQIALIDPQRDPGWAPPTVETVGVQGNAS